MSKRIAALCLCLVALVIAGTLTVLGTAKHYFDIDVRDVITLEETQDWEAKKPLPYGTELNEDQRLQQRPVEKIPRIIHQTWKTNVLPEKWLAVRDKCLEMHPDYEYMLWTDEHSRDFIAQSYPWFLETWDNYTYPIQRADAIRYFVLHHYGGVYVDLDIGCKRPLDPLLNFEVILPHTIPIGVSNDLIFSSPKHPFMELTIHNLITFDHTYGTNYPTVMFSTGPMFLSAQYNLWPSADGDHGGVRVLPKSLYGKNAKPEDAQFSFFWHYYGSSWHANDASFIQLLGKFGMFLLYAASGCVVLGILRMIWSKRNMIYGRPVGPISLPFTPSTSDFLNGYVTPASSRPTSPLPFHRDTRRRSPSTPQSNSNGKLFWVPMFLSSDGADKSTSPDPSQSKWQSAVYDAASNSWQATTRSAASIDPDRASLHSMHTIKAVPRRRLSLSSVSSNAGAQTTDYSSSEDDSTESRGLLARRRRARGPAGASGGLPPSYSNLFSNWAASLFRPASGSSPSEPVTPNIAVQKPLLEATSPDPFTSNPASVGWSTAPGRTPDGTLVPPPLSRQSSTYSSAPPAYPEDGPGSSMDVATVDQLLNEMDPQRRR